MLTAPLKWRHYRGLAEALRRYVSLRSDLYRYLTGTGTYPYRCHIRTAVGMVAPTLYSHHDMLTVHEVFCRRIYPVDPEARVIVDVGSNIGISALYFLTAAPHARCHLFEANPALIDRLRKNLRGFEARVTVSEVALAASSGDVDFGVEASGRYGGIGVPAPRTIEVRSRAATDALEEILKVDGEIDLFKLDIEGTEIDLLRSLPATVLEQIRAIHLETLWPGNPLPLGFRMSKRVGAITSLVRAGA